MTRRGGRSGTPQPNARLVIDLTALRRGIVGGLVLIVPVSLIVALPVPNRSSTARRVGSARTRMTVAMSGAGVMDNT